MSKLWLILDRKGYSKHLINVIKTAHKGTNKNIPLSNRQFLKEKFTNRGLSQGCCLTLLLYTVYILSLIHIFSKFQPLQGIFTISKRRQFNFTLAIKF